MNVIKCKIYDASDTLETKFKLNLDHHPITDTSLTITTSFQVIWNIHSDNSYNKYLAIVIYVYTVLYRLNSCTL